MNSLVQLHIPKRQKQCADQGEPLLPGMEIYSLLLDSGDERQLARRDFCSACWSAKRLEASARPDSRGYWKSKIEVKKAIEGSSRIDRAITLLKELLRSLEFEKGESVNEQQFLDKEGEVFVLSLFLARAKALALRQEFEKNGLSYQLFEILRNEEFITVKVVRLSHLEIDRLQKSLASQLQGS